MKTNLPAKSKDHQARIKEISDIIVNIGNMVVQFIKPLFFKRCRQIIFFFVIFFDIFLPKKYLKTTIENSD